MAKTQFEFKTEAVKPFYAVAGATDLAVEYARGYVTEAQKLAQDAVAERRAQVTKLQEKVQGFEFKPKAVQTQAKTLVNTRVEDITKQTKDAQAKIEALPAKAQALVNDTVTELNETYVDLVARGEKVVVSLRKGKAPAKKATAKKTTTAKKAPAKKAPAKKATAKKASA